MKNLSKRIAIIAGILLISVCFIGTANAVETKNNLNIEDVSNNETENNTIQNESKDDSKKVETPSVVYDSHIQNIGWESSYSKKDGETSGTTGKSLRIEAMHIKLNNSENIKIKYQAHVENIGWQNWVEDGNLTGTTGKGLRIEALRVELENTDKYSVEYNVHVENIGWQGWKSDGEIAGTTGKSLRIEAIQIRIVPKIEKARMYIDSPENNKIFYENDTISVVGWKMCSVKDSKILAYVDGSSVPISDEYITYSKRDDVIKAIENYGTEKENPTPGFTVTIDTTKFNDKVHNLKLKIDVVTSDGKVLDERNMQFKIDKSVHVKYQSHIKNIGWQGEKYDNETSGTQGQSLRIEAFKIKLINADGANQTTEEIQNKKQPKIKYQAHVENIGWQNWAEDGNTAGTTGQGLRVEAFRIELENLDNYSVKYRAYIQDLGWQDWCYDGEMAGIVGKKKRVESFEIQIVPKIKDVKNRIYIDSPSDLIYNENGNISGWVMTTESNTNLRISIDGNQLDSNQIRRNNRQDVLNSIKGYGKNNAEPGFSIGYNFGTLGLGYHNVKVEILKDGKVISQTSKDFLVKKRITHFSGVFGRSGLKIAGDGRGQDLQYLRWGDGPNVFFATFAIHGFEDNWNYDGWELTQIANDFYNQLVASEDASLADKWTIYIFPAVNIDGLSYGYSKNGPGRTTLFSAESNHRGVDMNRCWSTNFEAKFNSRNYTGGRPFLAYEAQQLGDFMLNHRATNGRTLVVDLHGWLQQLIGDPTICSYYKNQFPENSSRTVGQYGRGYMIAWARSNLGAQTALVELPERIYSHQDVINNGLSVRYRNATLSMLRGM